VLRRRLWLVVAGVLLGLLGALLSLQVAAREYTATTTVSLNVISKDPFNSSRSPAGLVDGATEAQTATSSTVLDSVATTLGGGTTGAQVRSRTTASVEPGSTVMRVSYTADNPADARAGADAIADAYLAYRSDQAKKRVQVIVDQLNQQRDTLRDDLIRANTVARDAQPGSVAAIQAQTGQQLINIELDSMTGQINSVLGLDTSGGQVLTAAAQSDLQERPARGLVLLVGLVLGLLLGIVAAIVADERNPRISNADDLRRAGGGIVLGELKGKRARIPASEEDAEAIRTMREVLLATLPGRPPVVAVADLTGAEPVSDLAVNLAHVTAETGRGAKLVIPDADATTVRRIAERLMLVPAPDSSPEVRRFAGLDGLLLVAGARRALRLDDPAIGSPNGHHAVSAPLTVIAVPKETAHSSLMAAARVGHAVVLVVSKGTTTKATVAEVARQLAVVGAHVHGTVLAAKDRESPVPAASEPVPATAAT
jgi:capsular polysaccharide biosynthesis protein